MDFAAKDVASQLAQIAPARTVPAVVTADGAILSESLSIAEELASRYPDAGLWPDDPKARVTARTVTAEMHAGFAALRADCPMALRVTYADFAPSKAVLADLERLETIWAHARAASRSTGPWLCGDYSAADAFFAPVAARIATYGLPVGEDAAAYVAAHLNDPAFRRWRAMGFAKGQDLPRYAKNDLTKATWPGPALLAARAVETGPSVNQTCPYSGKPVTHFMEAGGKIWGFCNAFCRDKTVADPLAWPRFAEIYEGS